MDNVIRQNVDRRIKTYLTELGRLDFVRLAYEYQKHEFDYIDDFRCEYFDKYVPDGLYSFETYDIRYLESLQCSCRWVLSFLISNYNMKYVVNEYHNIYLLEFVINIAITTIRNQIDK